MRLISLQGELNGGQRDPEFSLGSRDREEVGRRGIPLSFYRDRVTDSHMSGQQQKA